MLELAKAQQRGPISISEIAKKQDIPPRFLEAILRDLKQAGVLNSVRGKEGGYLLAKDAGDVSVSEIICLFNDSLILKNEVEDSSCAFVEVADSAEGMLKSFFDSNFKSETN